MKPYLLGAGLVCSLAFMNPVSARAAVVSAACTISSFTVTNTSPTAAATLTCPQFNSALGTLTDYGFVSNGVNYAPGSSTSVTLQNNTGAALPNQFVFAFQWSSTGTLPGGVPLNGIGVMTGLSAPVLISPTDTQTLTGVDFELPVLLSPKTNSLSSFVGNGSFNVPLSIVSKDITFNNYDPGIDLVAYTATVTSLPGLSMMYEYTPAVTGDLPDSFTPAPEPLSAGLAVSGLFALVASRVRLRR